MSAVFENKLCVSFFSLLLSVFKAQNLISSIKRTDGWGYKHHKVTLGQLFIRVLSVYLLPSQVFTEGAGGPRHRCPGSLSSGGCSQL